MAETMTTSKGSFTKGFVGEVMTTNGAEAFYFHTAQEAHAAGARAYECWVPDGVRYYGEEVAR